MIEYTIIGLLMFFVGMMLGYQIGKKDGEIN